LTPNSNWPMLVDNTQRYAIADIMNLFIVVYCIRNIRQGLTVGI
jgi:hypothetical protein